MTTTDSSNTIPANYRQVVAIYLDDGGDEYKYLVACHPKLFECPQSERENLVGALQRFCDMVRNPPPNAHSTMIV